MEALTAKVEKLLLRRDSLDKALKTLEKSLNKLSRKEFTDYEELRDSIIKRFEYSADTFWKYLKDYIEVSFKIEVAFAKPKGVFRECFSLNVISEKELTILENLIEDRNLTSHSYNEETAEEISINVQAYYYPLMRSIIDRLALP